MRLAIIAALVSGCWISHAAGQTSVYKYDSDAINASIKCELAQAERLFRKTNVDRGRMRAFVTITGEETTFVKAGLNVNFLTIFRANAEYSQKKKRLRGAKGVRFISAANGVNCKKSFVVDVGILSCFQEQRSQFLDNQTITCSEDTTATATAGAGGGFTKWLLDASPSGEISKTRVWKID